MKHDVFSVDQIKIACPDTVLAANFLRHLPVLTEHVSGSQCAFYSPNGGSIEDADIEISFSASTLKSFESEKIGRISVRPYHTKSHKSGWIASTSGKASLDLSGLEERAFGTPANMIIPSMTSRISVMKATGMSAILPDVIAGLDTELIGSDDPKLIQSFDLWLNVDPSAKQKSSVKATVEWMKACADSMNWLNAPMNWEPVVVAANANRAFH
jgi:hypothetical protein